MNQKEFQELSENEVKQLNGYDSLDYVNEAWRGGYIYAQAKIKKLFEEKFAEDFLSEIETFINDDLEEFDFDDME